MPFHKGVEVLALPPPGYEVDFDNPRREAVPVPYYVAAFGVALTLVFMGQRMFVKLRISGGLQIDDCESSALPDTKAWGLMVKNRFRLTSPRLGMIRIRVIRRKALWKGILIRFQAMAMITIALCVRKYEGPFGAGDSKQLTRALDMFANGAGGVHIWEISVDTYLIYAMVSEVRSLFISAQ